MVTSHIRGHKIYFTNDEWFYADTKTPTANNERPCGYCSKKNTKEGHDGCLGTLIGLMNACCGHGETKEAYVQFLDSSGVFGEDAITILDILKKVDHRVKIEETS